MGSMHTNDDIRLLRIATEKIADCLCRFVDSFYGGPAVGVVIQPGPVTENEPMAKPKATTVKKSSLRGASPKKASAGATVDFQFVDNGDSTCTVLGVDAGGNTLDISAVATLTPAPTSSDTALVTVDPPSGMTFAMHAVGPLSTPGTPVNITAVATWNDGSIGPFTFTLPVDVIAGGPTGIQIVPGPVTVR